MITEEYGVLGCYNIVVGTPLYSDMNYVRLSFDKCVHLNTSDKSKIDTFFFVNPFELNIYGVYGGFIFTKRLMYKHPNSDKRNNIHGVHWQTEFDIFY